jgi:hypothetical protein
MTLTSHRIPSGAEAMVEATVCSADELARVISQQSTTASAAKPRRMASLPRRLVCPSPTGAKKMARHGLPPRRPDDGVCGVADARESSSDAATGSVTATWSLPSDLVAIPLRLALRMATALYDLAYGRLVMAGGDGRPTDRYRRRVG